MPSILTNISVLSNKKQLQYKIQKLVILQPIQSLKAVFTSVRAYVHVKACQILSVTETAIEFKSVVYATVFFIYLEDELLKTVPLVTSCTQSILFICRAYLLLDLARIGLELNLAQVVALCVEQMRNNCVIKVYIYRHKQ